MYLEESCSELEPCPWCKDDPILCSDGFCNYWVECQNSSLPSESGRTCPVCPRAWATKETLKVGAVWTREQAIEKWNSLAKKGK